MPPTRYQVVVSKPYSPRNVVSFVSSFSFKSSSAIASTHFRNGRSLHSAIPLIPGVPLGSSVGIIFPSSVTSSQPSPSLSVVAFAVGHLSKLSGIPSVSVSFGGGHVFVLLQSSGGGIFSGTVQRSPVGSVPSQTYP